MHVEPYKFSFNFQRYFELRKKRRTLILNDQNLEKLEYDELSDYSRQLVDYLCWKDKNNFLRLIENFLNSELDCLDFDSQFFDLRDSKQELAVSKYFEKIANIDSINIDSININNQFYNLIELISGIMIAAQLYQNTLDDDKAGFTEERYQETVADLYQRYKKALVYDSAIDVEVEVDPLLLENSVNVKYKDNRVLQETMIFFTVITGVAYTFLNPTLFDLLETVNIL